jgi:hypothetical protein
VNHYTVKEFWDCYHRLPPEVQEVADKNFELLKTNPRHNSVRLKKVGDWYSARAGSGYRALAIMDSGSLVWFWIGSHAEYDEMV